MKSETITQLLIRMHGRKEVRVIPQRGGETGKGENAETLSYWRAFILFSENRRIAWPRDRCGGRAQLNFTPVVSGFSPPRARFVRAKALDEVFWTGGWVFFP